MKSPALDKVSTRVVFRVFKEGDVIALFPDLPATRRGWDVTCYQHIGQHGAADPTIVYDTRPAKPAEYADLKRELESLGYVLTVMQRMGKSRHLCELCGESAGEGGALCPACAESR